MTNPGETISSIKMYGRKHEFCIRVLWFALRYCSSQHYSLVSAAGSCNKFQSKLAYSARCCSCLLESPYQSCCSGRLAAGLVPSLATVTQGVGRGATSCQAWVRECLPTGLAQPSPGDCPPPPRHCCSWRCPAAQLGAQPMGAR